MNKMLPEWLVINSQVLNQVIWIKVFHKSGKLFKGWNESDIQHCLAAQELNLIVSELLIDFTAQPQNLQDHKHNIHLRALLLRRT